MNEILQLPCLGRLFRPGMLYDSRSDNLIPNTSLWDSDRLQDAINSKPQIESTYSVIEEDNIDSKCHHLGITPGLKLSMLSGLAKSIKGSASFFHDLSNLARVCVIFKHTTKLEEFSLEEIGDVQYPHIIEEHSNVATHVVTGVLYGADGIIVFDRVVGDNEKHREVHGNMLEIVEGLVDSKGTSSIGHLNDSGKYRCKFYGDFTLPKNLTTFQDALETFSQLHSLSENSRPVPMVVYLSPLSKIDHQYTPVIQQISDDLNMQVQGVIESLSQCDMQVNDILDKYKVFLSNFENLHDHLLQFKKLLSRYKKDLMKQMAMSLPKIRMESATEKSLAKVFRDTEARASPYNSSSLTSWLKQKEEEIKKLKIQVQSVENYQFFSSTRELDCFFEDEDCQYVVCLAFNLVQQDDHYLRRMQSYQRTQTLRQSTTPPSQWYKNAPLMKTLKQCIKQFKSFAEANSGSECVKFAVVGSIQDDEFSENQGVILLYEASVPRIWVPPGPPGKPLISDVTHNSVRVTLQKPKYGDTSVTSYTILYSSVKDSQLGKWKRVPMTDQGSVVVTRLISEEEYVFKVCPECEAGQGPESETSGPIETKLADSVQQMEARDTFKVVTHQLESNPFNQPTKPVPTRVTYDTVELEWIQPTVEGGSISFYIVYYRCVDSSNDWKNQATTSPQPRATMSALVSGGGYEFKVQPFTSSGPGSESEVSDVIKTKATSPPGKPTATYITKDSIELNWKAPDYGLHNIEHYTVSYQALDDPSKEWKTLNTRDIREKITVTGLSAQTKYIFKVIPQCKSGTGCESETSDPIETKRKIVCQPGKPESYNVTHDTIQLRWSKPAHNSENIQFYIVFYGTVDDSPEQYKPFPSNGAEESVVVSTLIAGTQYVFKVQPMCTSSDTLSCMESECSDPIQTLCTSKPGEPRCIALSNSSIKLQWSEPDIVAEPIQAYNVLIHDMLNQSHHLHTVQGNHNEAVVDKLETNKKYTIKIKAKCQSGDGAVSDSSDPVCTNATSPPGKPNASVVLHDSIQVTWTKPTHGSENIINYTLLYRQVDASPDEWIKETLERSEECFTLQNLELATSYVFKVRPECGISAHGTESDISNPIKTKSTSEPSVPRASTVTCDSVVLEWEKPEIGHENIQYYTISSSDPSLKWKKHRTTVDPHLRIHCTGLTPNTSYTFSVCPMCKDGAGTESISQPIQTKSYCKPGKPQASFIAHDGVQLEWTTPKYGSDDVKSYIVYYIEADDPSPQWKPIGGNCFKESIKINKLNPQTSYIFRVYPQCKECNGTFSDDSDPIETLATSPPGKPTVKNVTHESVRLKWAKPSFGSNNIKSYSVLCRCPVQSSSVPCVMVEDRKATVSGLDIKSKYFFKILAVCEYGIGAFSEQIEVETKQACKPGKPEVSSVSHEAVWLKWSNPEHGSSTVKNYTVLYRQTGDVQEKWIKVHTLHTKKHFCIAKLIPATSYEFKVFPECNSGIGVNSDVSDEVVTLATSPPGKPVPTSVTHDSIEIKWARPQEGSQNIESYTVFYAVNSENLSNFYVESTASTSKWRDITTAGVQERAEINGLFADTDYIVKVQPNCKVGLGCKSLPSDIIMTKPSCQPGAPKCVCVTHNFIQLEWESPNYDADKVEFYTLSYQLEDDVLDNWTSAATKFTSPFAEVDGLQPDTGYVFRVFPESHPDIIPGAVFSYTSDIIKTKSTSKPGTPEASIITHNSIELQWTPPDYGYEKIKSYSIIYTANGHTDITNTNSNHERMEVSGLALNTTYEFRVRPESEDNVGCESKSSTFMTRATSKPGKPRDIGVYHNGIVLEWEAPTHGSQNVVTYTIYCRKMSTPSGGWTTAASSVSKERCSAIVAGLTIDTEYIFKVHSECSSGEGDESDISDPIETNMSSHTGKPRACEDKITHEKVCLEWDRPLVGYEEITHYAVLYCSQHEKETEWRSVQTSDTRRSMVVGGLRTKTKYIFKVQPMYPAGSGAESTSSDLIETKVTSPPTKPVCVKATHNSVELQWEKSSIIDESDKIKYYFVKYQTANNSQMEWNSKKIDGAAENCTVSGLTPKTFYSFKVCPVCSSGNGTESEVSDTISTLSLCKPEPPQVVAITHESIELEWKSPVDGADFITSYTIYYSKKQNLRKSTKWKSLSTKERRESIIIPDLTDEAQYLIKVEPGFLQEPTIGIEPSDTVCFETEPKPLAERIRSKSELIEDGPPAIYKVPTMCTMKDEEKRIAMLDVGISSKQCDSEKVLMVVGQTGAGKTTLINGIANYLFKVCWNDQFRFKLITDADEGSRSQTHSQTSWITAYTFYPCRGSRIQYKLTVIDTPGFGDTEGILRDKEIVQQVKEFLSIKGINWIHGVGFVVQAPLARLTTQQEYVLKSVLAVFGNDIARNISLLVTFADGQEPPVLAAVKEASDIIPYHDYFKFNNSALFAKSEESDIVHSKVNEDFWEMGMESLEFFIDGLKSALCQSLTKTREVLNERNHLEAYVQQLHKQLCDYHLKMEELQENEEILKTLGAKLKANEEFRYQIKVMKHRKVDLGIGHHVTNCLECNVTCHENCPIADDDKKYKCTVMRSHNPNNAYCTVCPKKCFWKVHKNNQYRFEYYQEFETRTSQDIKKCFDLAKQDKTEVVRTIPRIKREVCTIQETVLDLVHKIQKSLKVIREIGLNPRTLDELEYVELLIEAEKGDGKPGFKKRLEALTEIRDQAEILSNIDTKSGRVWGIAADQETKAEIAREIAEKRFEQRIRDSRSRFNFSGDTDAGYGVRIRSPPQGPRQEPQSWEIRPIPGIVHTRVTA